MLIKYSAGSSFSTLMRWHSEMMILVRFWQLGKNVFLLRQQLAQEAFETNPIIRSQQNINVRIHGEVNQQ